MLVTLVRLTMIASHAHSLKERRAVVRSIVDKVFARHKVRVAEVGGQDSWQRIDLGFAIVGSERVQVDKVADEILRFIEDLDLARRVDLQREQLSFGEHRETSDPLDGWVPEFAKDQV
ncbi:MAG: DUF503 domain-containing protein [Deltaproteobacteria bacterium]|jgi:uncharacterized protein YlxP (DUF503 family)|nr:DUF503 domain-containing protein [Deltaproteobacteria bacterium]